MGSAFTSHYQNVEGRWLAKEIFHELSQPLTAVQCGLELALRRDQSFEELHASVETALENANSLRQRLVMVRALDDACDPGDGSQTTDLYDLMQELREDMLPMFESAAMEFCLEQQPEPVVVRGERIRLLRALFYFFEYLFRYSSERAVTAVRVGVNVDGRAELQINAETSFPMSPADIGETDEIARYSCEAEMVRRSFRALGGDFVLRSEDADQSVWLGTLPLA